MVSILVLLEPPLILYHKKPVFPAFEVSILVLLEPPLILSKDLMPSFTKPVSILVLLEPPLIHFRKSLSYHTFMRFQSLFYWNLLSYVKVFDNLAHKKLVFQSLFYWNLLSYGFPPV